jgi:hypothetical protein
MSSLDKTPYFKKVFEEIEKISITENPPEIRKSAGDIYIGKIENEKTKKISIYLKSLGEEIEDLQDIVAVVDDVDGTETLFEEDIKELRNLADLEDEVKVLDFFLKKRWRMNLEYK